jgi:hypothetical protein
MSLHLSDSDQRQQERDRERMQREALDRLSRVHGEGGLRATLLALVMDDEAEAVSAVWQCETADVPSAHALREDVLCLDERTRLPTVEALLDRVRALPKAQRRPLLRSYRRVMAARGAVRPIDRLQWLQMRRRLGDRPLPALAPAVNNEMTRLPLEMREHVAAVTSYLARIVPDGRAEVGAVWRDAVLARFMPLDDQVPRVTPDADGLAHACSEIGAMPWMLRPVLMRAWVDCAVLLSEHGRLSGPTADALRLMAGLLDSPLPPALARCYAEVNWPAREALA